MLFGQRDERGSILVTTNHAFNEWTEVFGSECLVGAVPDLLTHHVHVLEMNDESFVFLRSSESTISQPSDESEDD